MTEDRKGLTFAQAEGAEPLPSQLALREVSTELMAVLWSYVYDSMENSVLDDAGYGMDSYLNDPWRTILRMWWILRLHKNTDEAPNAKGFMRIVKEKLTSGNYIDVFDFLQFVMQRPECPYRFPEVVNKILSNTRSSYRVIDNLIIPISSDEQADAVRRAMAVSRVATAQGPHSHLRSGTAALSAGKWAEAVRESIHSVEAAAKSIEPSASTLGPALDKLKSSIGLNPALSKAYGALYGYSSDERGIRHALVFEGVADVTERDAVFMFGACAAFVGYLLSSPPKV